MRRGLAVLAAVGLIAAWPGVAQAATPWTYEAVPLPAGVAHGTLLDVSCAGAASCMAVGFTVGSTSVPLVEYWDGINWTITSTVRPADAVGEYNLFGVSCPAPGNCTGVGWYTVKSGDERPVAEHWDGTNWTIQPMPVPAGSMTILLNGVSCAAADDCMAVGSASRSSVAYTLVEHWDGSNWTIEPTPNGSQGSSLLTGVSCAAPDSCMAIGRASPGPLAEYWDGTSWTVQPFVGHPGGLSGISCPAVNDCIAVGSGSRGGVPAPLAVHWDGTNWTVQKVPVYPGTPDAANNWLTGVSCTTTSSCTAVGGDYRSKSGSPGEPIKLSALSYRWTGSRWIGQATAQPPGRRDLNAVSCTTPTTCTAVGSTVMRPRHSYNQPIAEHE